MVERCRPQSYAIRRQRIALVTPTRGVWMKRLPLAGHVEIRITDPIPVGDYSGQ